MSLVPNTAVGLGLWPSSSSAAAAPARAFMAGTGTSVRTPAGSSPARSTARRAPTAVSFTVGADKGTRFKVFGQPGVPRTPWEKADDAAQVHRFTGVAPSMAVHIPWDKVDDYV